MSSSYFIESPRTTVNESHKSYETELELPNDQENNNTNDFNKNSCPSNLVVVYGRNGIQVNREELQKLVADESNLSTISVIRLTSPTPSMKEDDDETEHKTKLRHTIKKKSNNDDIDNALNENTETDSHESILSESNSVETDEKYSDDDLLAILSGTEKNRKQAKRHNKIIEKPESAGLIIEGFYPPEEAKILAKEILNLSGINRLTFKLDKKFQELQLLALSNDHCYTPLLSPTQEPSIEKIPDNKKVPIQPPEKIQQKLINLKQSAIAKQRSSSNDSTNKLDPKHKNSTDELTGDNETGSEDQSDEESESVDTDNDRDSDLDFSVSGAGKRKVRRTKKISINKITNKRQKRQSSHEDEDLNKRKTKVLHRLSTEGAKLKTDLCVNKIKIIDTSPKIEKNENVKNERVLMKIQQKLPTTPLIPLGVGKSVSLLRKTIESENTVQPLHGKSYKEELTKSIPQKIVLIKPQEKSTGGFADISKYLSKLGGEGEITNPCSSESFINRKIKEPSVTTHSQIPQSNFVQFQKKNYVPKENITDIIEHTQTSGENVCSSHEDKELIDSLVNDEMLQPIPNHGQMNIPNLVKMLESTEQTILNQRSNEISTFQQHNPISAFANTIANANVDDIPEDLLKDVAELIDNNTLEEFVEKQQAFHTQPNNNILDFENTIPTNLLVGTPLSFPQKKDPDEFISAQSSSQAQLTATEPISASPNQHNLQTQSLIKPVVQVVQRNGRVITLPPIEAPNTRAKRKAATVTSKVGTGNQTPKDQKSNNPKQTKSSSRRNSKEMGVIKVCRPIGESHQKRTSTSSQKQNEKSVDYDELNQDEDDLEEDENDTDFNEDDDPDKLWCICRQPHNNRFMICCDVCEDWFHGTCVNVTKAMGLEMEQNGIDWTCPKCVRAKKPVQRKISEMFEKKIEVSQNIELSTNNIPEIRKNSPQITVIKSIPPNRFSSDNNTNITSNIKSHIQKKLSDHLITLKKTENENKPEQRIEQTIMLQKKEPVKEQTMKAECSNVEVLKEQIVKVQMVNEYSLKLHTMKEQTQDQKVKEPIVKDPIVKDPIAKESIGEKQILKEAIVKLPFAKELIVKEQITRAPVVKEEVVKEQVVKQHIIKDQIAIEQKSKERTTKSKPLEIENIECKVCKKSARPNSIYCSDECIRKHAQNAISMKIEKSSGSDILKKKSSFEEALGAAAVSVKKVERISVFERKSGKIITGLNAPTTASLKKWLQENPTFEVVQPGSAQQMAIDKKYRIQSQSSVESVNSQDTFTKIIKADHGVIKIEHSNVLKTNKPFIMASIPSTSKAQNVDKKLPTKYSQNPTLKSDKIDNKHMKPKLIIQKESKESKESKDIKQNQNAVRLNIVKHFREHLTARMNEITSDDHPKLTEAEIEAFSNEIEEEMYYLYNKDAASAKYRIKYRSLQFNLNDRKNTTLFHKICAKMVGAKQLVRMSPEELASQELAAWRQQENKHQLEMIKNAELDLLACAKNYVLKTHKGEEVIESKTSDRISLDVAHIPVEDVVTILNNSTVSSTSELEKSNSSMRDSYKEHHESKTSSIKHSQNKKRTNHSKDRDHREKHHKGKERHKEKSRKRSRSRSRDRSSRHSYSSQSVHKDDRACKDDKKSHEKHRDKKNRDKSFDKSISKVHISPAYSTSNSTSSKNENIQSKSIESFNLVDQILESSTKSIEEAANLTSAKDKILLKDENSQEFKKKPTILTSPLDSDQEPTSTVQITTPPIDEDCPDPYSIYVKQSILWTGSINMIDVATFQIHIQPISGPHSNLEKDLSTELDVVGRISPDTVWDYIAKIKKSINKEILIVRLIPANETENIGYSALYMYLDKRKRLGVVKSETPTIKDFYLLPLGSQKSLPNLLKTNEHVAIFEDEPRPDLLLGIIIRVMGINYVPTMNVKRSAIVDIANPNNKIIRREPESVIISNREHLLENTEDHYTPPGSPSVKIATTESHSLLNIGGKLPGNKEETENIDEILNQSPAIMIQDDEPYSPGDSSESTNHSIPGLSISKEDEELKRKMDEINRQIEVQEMEIAGMLGASNSRSDAYSPSNLLSRTSLPTRSLANISIPSNLQQILASIKKPPLPPPDEEEYNPEEPINSLMECKSSKINKTSGSRLAQLTEEELLSMVPDDIDINIPKKEKSLFITQPPPPGLEDDEEFS